MVALCMWVCICACVCVHVRVGVHVCCTHYVYGACICAVYILPAACICAVYILPAADKTFCSRSGNEKVRKTIVADAAMLAPSPESLTECESSIDVATGVLRAMALNSAP